ncbi:unnamed protein product [Timema podura]|uniref:Uncharacterized protein n=1 Tax=Timema podura TaxID=61482 RepID=A0ABN7NFK1_TIMPD|nr:unnamed protein product [Timema podura]
MILRYRNARTIYSLALDVQKNKDGEKEYLENTKVTDGMDLHLFEFGVLQMSPSFASSFTVEGEYCHSHCTLFTSSNGLAKKECLGNTSSRRGHEECWPPHRKPKKKLGWKNGYIPLSKKKNKSTSFIKQDQDGKPLVSERLLDPANEAGVATQVVGDHHLEYDSLYVMDVYHIHNEDSMKEGTSPNNITIELCTVPYHVVSQFVQLNYLHVFKS